MSQDVLHSQLIKLGDMMGDGLHREPGGKWIEKEYKKTMRALGIGAKRKNHSEQINKAMSKSLLSIKCPNCKGDMIQTKSGSMRAKCKKCNSKYQILKRGKK